MMQGTTSPFYKWDILVPGSSIPERFIHQNTGSSITAQLPPHWYNTNLMGLAVCAVFAVDPAIDRLDLDFTVLGGFDFQLDSLMIGSVQNADHMWFGYRSLYGPGIRYRSEIMEGFIVQSRAMKILFHGCGYRRISNESLMRDWERPVAIEVKKCGFFLVYDQESENPLWQTEHPIHHLSSRSKLFANFFIFPSNIFLRD